MTERVRLKTPLGANGEKDPNDWAIQQPGKLKKVVEERAGPSPLDWTDAFTVTSEEVEEYGDPNWAYPNLIIESHILALVADPGGGKTTVCTFVAGELVKRGYQVIYTLADIGKGDIAHYHEMSEAHGWRLLLPDVKAGLSMDDVVQNLAEMNATGGNFSNVIMFFDTLKKMADVINKRMVRELLSMLRQLTAKGMTIVLIGHTNKYKDENGDPVFEGTHDIKTDSDDLIFLVPMKRDDGSMVTSTKPSNKVRGEFEAITFEIGRDRTVRRLEEFVDTLQTRKDNQQYEEDLPDIEVITDAIKAGKHRQSEIIEHCLEHRVSKRKARRILKTYAWEPNQLWTEDKGFQNNTRLYHLKRENQ